MASDATRAPRQPHASPSGLGCGPRASDMVVGAPAPCRCGRARRGSETLRGHRSMRHLLVCTTYSIQCRQRWLPCPSAADCGFVRQDGRRQRGSQAPDPRAIGIAVGRPGGVDLAESVVFCCTDVKGRRVRGSTNSSCYVRRAVPRRPGHVAGSMTLRRFSRIQRGYGGVTDQKYMAACV